MNRAALVISCIAWLVMVAVGNLITVFWSGLYDQMIGLDYNRTLLTINYWNSGFARRALAGTVAIPFGDLRRPETGIYFHAASVVWLATPLAVLLYRVTAATSLRTGAVFAFLLCISPLLFLSWSADLARVDMLTCGFVAWAVVAGISGRPIMAGVLLCLGALCHELALIYGLPLLLVITYERGARHEATTFLATCAALLIPIYAAQMMFAAPAAQLVANMAVIPDSVHRDIAIYAYAWNFIPAAICSNLVSDHYWPGMAWCSFAIVCLAIAHGGGLRGSLPLLFASLLPFLVICAITTDLGRYLSIAALNIWLLAASLAIMRERAPWPSTYALAGYIALALLAWAPGPTEPLHPNVALKELGRALDWGSQWPMKWEGERQCLPHWRETVRAAMPGGNR